MDFSPQTSFVATIPVRKWTETMRGLLRSRPLHVTVDRSRGFRHPWHIRARWAGERRRWEIEVYAGFVNYWETIVSMPAAEAPAATRERLGADATDDADLDAWLSESPAIPVPSRLMRPIGDDLAGGLAAEEPVPDYFRALGVGGPRYDVQTDLAFLSQTVSVSGELPDASARRWLRAVEVVLVQPRAALDLQWGEGQQGGTGLALQIGVRQPADPRPRLALRKAWRAETPATGLEQLAAGAAGDPGLDELHLATLYFLSPAGADASRPPDGDWEVIPAHRCWWNLHHDVSQTFDALPQEPIPFPGLGLGAGAGDVAIAAAVRQNNALAAQADALLNQSRIEGAFWTV